MEEPILSEELREELGDHPDIVIISKKKRKKGENEVGKVALPDEVTHSIKKQSKRQKKCFEQNQNKKMRASKQGDYISAIKSHEISPQHRELLASSTSLNQTKSLKQTLTALLKKERAGISLTDGERAILYKTRDVDENDEPEVFSSSLQSSIALREADNITAAAKNSKGTSLNTADHNAESTDSGLLFSFDTITTSNKKFDEETAVVEKVDINKFQDKKKSKKKRSREEEYKFEVAAAIAPAEEKPLSLGQRMLQQFGKLKDKSFAKKVENVDEAALVIPSKAVEEPAGSLAAEEEVIKSAVPSSKPNNTSKVGVTSNVKTIVKGGNSINQDNKSKKQKVNSNQATTAPAVHVTVHRPADIEENRMQLPVSQMEQEIIEAVNANDTIILCGETGSGKSTQLPIFLYEAGYTLHDQMIGIAQPRRVAVISTAERVHYEMGSITHRQPQHRLVGYQIRHESQTIGSQTAIKFMTDGILLREISDDILLRKYRVIILDEAHERNVNTDILLGLLSRSVPLRKRISWEENAKYRGLSPEDRLTSPLPIQPLKLIIMSATLRTEDFLQPQLFPSKLPPIIKVESRTFPITVHFNKRTELNHQAKGVNGYLEQCYKKILAMHRKLPPGGILVFVTGKREILALCRRVKRKLLPKDKSKGKDAIEDMEEEEEFDSEEGDDFDDGDHDSADSDGDDDQEHSDNEEEQDMDEADQTHTVQEDNNEDDDFDEDNSNDEGDSSVRQKMLAQLLGRPLTSIGSQAPNNNEEKQHDEQIQPHQEEQGKEEEQVQLIPVIYPLFAMMPAAAQARIFQPLPSPNHRLIVIATNVAETSITIPGIRYVLDSGRCKQRVSTTKNANDEDGKSGVGSRYEVQWISQAAAEQRAGRAGRTGPGHVYRLYSAQFYHEHMDKFMPPEITRTPCEEVLLHMMALGIENVDVFPFPTPPPPRLVHQAITLLTNLGAICTRKMEVNALGRQLGRLSSLGQWLRLFPLHPRFGKMIVVAITLTQSMQSQEQRQRLLGHVLTMAATLAERSVFELDGRVDNDDDEEEESVNRQQEGEEMKAKAKHPPLWHHSSGDAMARLRATGAYLHCLSSSASSSSSGNNVNPNRSKPVANITTAAFCRTQSLHEPTLLRILDLRRQLQHITQASIPKITGYSNNSSNSSNSLLSLESPSTPPTTAEEQALRQILLAGYCDGIARKSPLGSVQGPGRNLRRRLTAYLSGDPAVTTPIYIHPTSNAYKSDPTANLPEFVCYGSLIRNQRGDALFMTTVTALQPQWIAPVCLQHACPLLSLSSPLATPPPYYDHDHEQCMVFVTPAYGSQKWTLPAMAITAEQAVSNMSSSGGMTSAPKGYRPQDLQYKLLARFLLTGVLKLSCRQILTSKALKEPNAIMQSKIHPKIAMLLRQLVEKDVKNRLDLVAALRRQPRFLLSEIEALVLPEVKEKLRQVWSRLTIEV